MMFFRIILLSMVLGVGSSLLAQSDKLDSLYAVLQQYDKVDSQRVNLLNQISWEFHTTDIDSAAAFAHRSRKLAESLDYKVGLARAYNLLGVVASIRGDKDTQEKWNEMALPIAEESQDSFMQSVVYNDLANIYASRNETTKALEFYQKSLRNVVVGDEVGEVFTLGNIAILYSNSGDEPNATIYWEKVIRKIDETRDPYVKAVALMNKAYYHSARNEPDSVQHAVESAQVIAEQNENYLIQVNCLQWLSDLARDEGKLELSFNYLSRAALLTEEKGLHTHDLGIQYDLIAWYIAHEDFDEARERLQDFYLKAEGDRPNRLNVLISYHDLAAQLAEALDNYKDAYQHQSLQSLYQDTLDQTTQLQRMAELEIQYGLERQQVEYELMEMEKKEGETTVKYHKTLNWALFAILILALVIVALVWLSARQKQQYAEQLKEEVDKKTADLRLKNEELEGFAHIVSHDLKEPLRNIMSFVNLIEKRGPEIQASEQQTYFGFIKRGANQLYNLVEDVLQFSKLRKAAPKIGVVDTGKLVSEVEDALKLKVEEKNAEIRVHDLPQIESSEALLFLIFKNLIENGITYNRKEKPLIDIRYQRRKDEHEFALKDNGMGIPMEFQEKVFKMFFRLHNRNEFEGTGLGLAIVKKLTDQLKGSICFESDGTGTTFFLKFPARYETATL
ncbi:MAG: tetratricopeptide repeat protein [Saprospiraceae bacterium]|nr:tetratricopeptide repeat protein [Saprospiraceae bacterium]